MLLKKFLLTGMAVLLSVSFILTGCPTDSGDGDSVNKDENPPSNDAVITTDAVKIKGGAVTGWTAADAGATYDLAKAGGVSIVAGASGASDFQLPDGATVAVYVLDAEAEGADDFATPTATSAAAFDGAFAPSAGETKYVYLKVTAQDTTTVKWYKITVTVTEKSTDATLASATVKGEDVTGIGAGGTFADPAELAVTIAKTAADSTGATTTFAPTDGKAVAKPVLAANAAGLPATETAFEAAAAYADRAIANGNVFLIRVTAEDGTTKLWYKVTVTVNITYTVTADGGPRASTTELEFAFDDAVTGLTADEITITPAANVTKGTLTGSGQTWTLGVTVNTAGPVTVAIAHTNAGEGGKTVAATPSTVTLIKLAVITAGDLAAGITTKYNERPVGTVVAKSLTITTNPAIASGTVSAEPGKFADPAKGWSVGDTQEFAITLEPKDGYTFVGGLSAADIAEAVLGEIFFLDKNLASNSTGTPADPFVVKVTYKRPNDTTIDNALLTAAEIEQYNDKPNGEEVETLNLRITGNSDAIAKVTVAAALGNQDPAAGWAVGDTQVFTITLESKPWYRFKGTTGSLKPKEVADAVLGPEFTGKLTYGIPKVTDLSYEVAVTYKEPVIGSVGISAEVDYSDILLAVNNIPSVSYADGVVTATVSGSGHTGFKWSIDGNTALSKGKVTNEGNVYTLTTGVLSFKNHSLTVTATKGEYTYSQTVTFTVAE
jgi:hypothetical protein